MVAMNVRTDTAPPAKRRRLNHQIEAAQPSTTASHTQPTLSLVGSHDSLPASDAYHHDGSTPVYEQAVLPCSASTIDDNEQRNSECCYGMLCNIPTRLSCGLSPNSKNIPVHFHGPSHLSSTFDGRQIDFDILCPLSARIIGEFGGVPELQTQLYCHSKLEFNTGKGSVRPGRRRGKPSQSWLLNILLFGPSGLEENIGAYLSRYKMYLQDPIGCERNVPYRNPHIIPSDSGEVMMTNFFDSTPGDLEIERLQVGPDLLAQLMEDDVPLPETEAPEIVKTPLFRHQKQALTFMMRREQGWGYLEGTRDVWSRQLDRLGRFKYINNVSGQASDEVPPDFRGGLLADDMGLGKTLSMISLIATNQAHPDLGASIDFGYTKPPMKTTLLVVPPALIQAWQNQFSMHLRHETLKTHVYHGQKRTDVQVLDRYDVIITTYHTVSAIWRKHSEASVNKHSIFSLNWHRVILDEAHTIQNPRSDLARACCALRSTRRWAITGTPIQNKLADFASIVKFLRVHPYSDPGTFDEEILRPWQNRQGANAEGFLRLKSLVRAITISRTKSVVQLPPRVDEVHHLNFTAAEREKYDLAKTQSRTLLEEAISSENQSGKTFNALWLLNILRLICNHGLLAQTFEKQVLLAQCPSVGRSPRDFSSPPDGEVLGGSACCWSCGANLLEDILEGSVSGLATRNQKTNHDEMICESCVFQIKSEKKLDHSLRIDQDDNSAPVTPIPDIDAIQMIEFMSTKIKALMADLHKHNATEKSVVFSYWTNTLDFVQLMLNDKGIPYTRIDGKTSLSKRNEALRSFQCDNSVRVILVSITCGGAGLDLTAGSRAYLLEPHWNPMIEEQALCRVHRVGQKRDVTTIRYLMRDSFEEQIVDIQKRKKMLAQVTFAQGPLPEDGIGLGTLQYLKSVLE
ncbi:related to global transactivator [Phialocephala subalpina]|uniref:Related to global transactivator n=1 Tax=Phialocephala subalpina TaxID=576137 RepID=A0A1L7XWX8_9HELO|nr:related to global transactivator [Phialocephala subalpina]